MSLCLVHVLFTWHGHGGRRVRLITCGPVYCLMKTPGCSRARSAGPSAPNSTAPPRGTGSYPTSHLSTKVSTCSAIKNQVEGSSINVSELSAHALSSRALCAGRSLTFMTGVILIITLARFVTQFVPAELKIMVSYTVLKIIRV